MPNTRAALQVQGGYYIVTGLWPLLSRRTFEAVTGRKTDWWLVQMVGLLAAAAGTALAVSARQREPSDSTRTLAVLAALSFAGIDVRYGASGRISKVYLADAAVELAFAALALR